MAVIQKPKTGNRVKAGTSKVSAEEKRTLFIEAYLSNNGNATQAAISAGYSPHSAERQGIRLTRDVRVKTVLDKRRTEVVAATELSTEKTIREVRRLAYSDPRNIMDENGRIKKLHELDADTAAAVSSYEVDKDGVVKYKFWDKNSALDKAAKVQGLYEKDNAQKSDPLTSLLQAIGGAVIGPRNG